MSIVVNPIVVAGGGDQIPYLAWFKSNVDDGRGDNFLKVLNGKIFSGKSDSLFCSDDGKTWNKLATYPNSSSKTSMTFGKNIYILGTDKGIQWSDDLIKWNLSDLSSHIYDCCYAPNGFVAGIAGAIYHSNDGKTWKSVYTSSETFYGITYANGLYVATTYTGGIALWSTDGISWNKANGTVRAQTVQYLNGLWITDWGSAYYSTDGKNWQTANVSSGSGGSNDFKKIVYANGKYLGITYYNFFTSEDGKTWIKQEEISTKFKGHFADLSYADGLSVLITAESTKENQTVYVSKDSINWIRSNLKGGAGSKLCKIKDTWVSTFNTGIWYSSN